MELRHLAIVLGLSFAACGKKPAPRADASGEQGRTAAAPVKKSEPPPAPVARTLGGIELTPLVEPGVAGEAVIEGALGLVDDKAKAIAALTKAGPASRKVVLALLASKSLDEVTGALEVLADKADPTGARGEAAEPLMKLLTHEVAAVRDRAWELAPDLVQGDRLLGLIDEAEPDKKLTVLRLLELWDSAAIREKLAALARSGEPALAREAALVLTVPTRPVGVEALTLTSELVSTPASQTLGLTLARRLKADPLPEELKKKVGAAIDGALLKPELDAVLAAMRATIILAPADRLPLLEQLAKDARDDVRRVAAETLGETRGATADLDRAREQLGAMLEDPASAVRIASVRGLAQLSRTAGQAGRKTLDRLIAKLSDTHRGVRLAAAVVLATLEPDAATAQAFDSQLGREDEAGRALILEAMAASRRRDLLVTVISSLDNPQTAPAAHQALTQASGKDLPATRAEWTTWLDATHPAPPVEKPRPEAPGTPAPKTP